MDPNQDRKVQAAFDGYVKQSEISVTDEMAAAAYNVFCKAINECSPCERCNQRGYHHGFGEDGCDPDWCDKCGGSGFVQKYDEQTAMKLAIKAALCA